MDFSTLHWIVELQYLFLGVCFLLRRKGYRNSNIYIGWILISMFFLNMDFALKTSGLIYMLRFLVELEWFWGFMLAPLVLMYVEDMLGQTKRGWALWMRFLLPLVALCYFAKFHFLSAVEQRLYIDEINSLKVYRNDYMITYMVFFIQMFAYEVYALVILYRFDTGGSKSALKTISWLKQFVWVHLLPLVIAIVMFMLNLPDHYYAYVPLTVYPIFLYIILRIIIDPQLLPSIRPVKNSNIKQQGESGGDDQVLHKKILRFLKSSRLYCENTMNLQTLSKRIGIPAYKISRAINHVDGVNFNDFINKLRIEEAKRLFTDRNYSNYTTEAIGQEVGFNSRASFINAFKRYEHITPGDYKKQQEG